MPITIIADEIIGRFLSDEKSINIIYDEAYSTVVGDITKRKPKAELYRLSTAESCAESFSACADSNNYTLVLTEPYTYSLLNIAAWLDFSRDEPTIKGLPSKVLVFPFDSAKRMFSGNKNADMLIMNSEYDWLKADRKYKITTDAGTNLEFVSRDWRKLDFEICTAPIESSVNGIIAVDGAVFFRALDGVRLSFTISGGHITSITSDTSDGNAIISEYREMTRTAFAEAVNTQLAEIGIGCNTNAQISDCFMEAETVYKTCHFCFGNNVCYGGANASDFHGGSVLIKKLSIYPVSE